MSMLDPSDELISAWQDLHDAQTAIKELDLSNEGLFFYLNQTTIREIDHAVAQFRSAHQKFLTARRDLHDKK